MKSSDIPAFAGRIVIVAMLAAILVEFNPALVLRASQADAAASLEKTKSLAEAQHEIVILLIQKKDYEKAASEANKIFDLKWPEEQEPLLVTELRNLTDQFLRSGQAPLGVKLIERNFGRFRKSSSQAALWKEMGYLYKGMNQIDKSIDCFKKARDLEGGK